MGDVSKNFNRNEFQCSCGCEFDAVDIGLIKWLEKIREQFNSPVIIHSACRCIIRNRQIGSKDTSQHVKAKAVDFEVKGVEHQKVYDYINKMIKDTGGLGIYDWGVHIDNRKSKARWDNRDLIT